MDDIEVAIDRAVKAYLCIPKDQRQNFASAVVRAEVKGKLIPKLCEKCYAELYPKKKMLPLDVLVHNAIYTVSNLETCITLPITDALCRAIKDLVKTTADNVWAGQMIPVESVERYVDLFAEAKKAFEEM